MFWHYFLLFFCHRFYYFVYYVFLQQIVFFNGSRYADQSSIGNWDVMTHSYMKNHNDMGLGRGRGGGAVLITEINSVLLKKKASLHLALV